MPTQIHPVVQHHKTHLSTSNPMLLVHRGQYRTCKTPSMEQDTTDIIFIFRINH